MRSPRPPSPGSRRARARRGRAGHRSVGVGSPRARRPPRTRPLRPARVARISEVVVRQRDRSASGLARDRLAGGSITTGADVRAALRDGARVRLAGGARGRQVSGRRCARARPRCHGAEGSGRSHAGTPPIISVTGFRQRNCRGNGSTQCGMSGNGMALRPRGRRLVAADGDVITADLGRTVTRKSCSSRANRGCGTDFRSSGPRPGENAP